MIKYKFKFFHDINKRLKYFFFKKNKQTVENKE